MDKLTFCKMKRRFFAFVAHAKGRGNGVGHPVQRDTGQDFISGKAALEIASTIGPFAKLLDNPRRYARW
jgi:hypothetical protein